VETMVPIDDPQLHPGLERVLSTCLADNRQAWELGSDGQYRRREASGKDLRATQATLIRHPWGAPDPPPATRSRRRRPS
jgi:polyphosphate kinase